MADLFCQMRLNFLDKYTPSRHNILLTGELATPYLPISCYQPTTKANETFIQVLAYTLGSRSVGDYFPNLTTASYEALPLDPNADGNRAGLPPAFPFQSPDLLNLSLSLSIVI